MIPKAESMRFYLASVKLDTKEEKVVTAESLARGQGQGHKASSSGLILEPDTSM